MFCNFITCNTCEILCVGNTSVVSKLFIKKLSMLFLVRKRNLRYQKLSNNLPQMDYNLYILFQIHSSKIIEVSIVYHGHSK